MRKGERREGGGREKRGGREGVRKGGRGERGGGSEEGREEIYNNVKIYHTIYSIR